VFVREIPNPTLMIPQYQFWVLFERTCVFAWIQFTRHFIELVFVQTNKLFHGNSNVIMTRQTCGQHSSRVAVRVSGLPIRDCSGSCNRSLPRCTNVSAIDVTAKKFLERLYLDLGLRQFASWVLSVCSYSRHRSLNKNFLISVQMFLPNGPSIFLSARFTK